MVDEVNGLDEVELEDRKLRMTPGSGDANSEATSPNLSRPRPVTDNENQGDHFLHPFYSTILSPIQRRSRQLEPAVVCTSTFTNSKLRPRPSPNNRLPTRNNSLLPLRANRLVSTGHHPVALRHLPHPDLEGLAGDHGRCEARAHRDEPAWIILAKMFDDSAGCDAVWVIETGLARLKTAATRPATNKNKARAKSEP